MSTGTVLMMLLGLGTVWGGAIVTIIFALVVEKRNKDKSVD